MSLLGKLMGRRSAADERRRGDELRARGEHGLAKLAYDRALDLAREEPEAVRAELAKCADDCRDALARTRLAEGEKLLRAGARELAIAEFEGAAETAAGAELIAEAERLIDAAERSDARDKATSVELSDDERFEVIAGSFEEDQYDEYERSGPELREALLALYDGHAARARPLLERVAQGSSEPRYLLFELGRARLLDGDTAGGREALERFTALFGEDEGGEARLVAHMELAALHDESGDFDAAAGQYEAALEAMPHDPRPYLAMAMFFRRSQLPAEAIEVLTSALGVLEEQHRQWRFTLELGLAHADLGQDERAIELLEDVVTQLTARQHLDLPPECAVRLAALHEKSGNKTRALDLYHLLSAGSDVANHFVYHRQAARLMLETGHRADARRMLARAAELAPDDPAIRAEIERQLAELK
jgi:tetratricopeptide (TPR) repeat protein